MSKIQQIVKPIVDSITLLLKPRTLIAFGFYGTFLYLIISKLPIPQVLTGIVGNLMGFYFGFKVANGKNGKH